MVRDIGLNGCLGKMAVILVRCRVGIDLWGIILIRLFIEYFIYFNNFLFMTISKPILCLF